MRKIILSLVMAAVLLPAAVKGQTYNSLWSQVKTAESKDLPRTQLSVLRDIEAKAGREKDYGQLLKAGLKRMTVMAAISPDSLRPAVAEMEMQSGKAKDDVLKAVYSAVLYRIYTDNAHILEGGDTLAARYRRLAMAEPARLAGASASGFDPLVVKGYNASVFGGDMLSVLGYEVEDFETLWRWYKKAGMRPAACISALELLRQHRPSTIRGLKKSEYLQSLDSIIHTYGDLDIACEAAIERYEYMSQCHDVTVEDKIRYIHYALDKWGAWQGAGRLRNAEKELTVPLLYASVDSSVVRPGVSRMLKLNQLRNVTSVTMNVYRVAVDGDTEKNAAELRASKSLLTELPDMRQTGTYMGRPPYQVFSDSLTIGALAPGIYIIELQTSPETDTMRELYYVSDVYCMSQELPGKAVRYVVVSATTGRPLAGAKIKIKSNRKAGNETVTTLTCDAQGEVIYKYADARPRYIYAYTDKDKASPKTWTGGAFSYGGVRKRTEQTGVFTDRSIYRPGQTVQVAAVVYTNDSVTVNRAVEGKKVKAVLRDANYKVVEEKELVTDRYGSCSTQFILPSDGLGGRFTVQVNNASAAIRVEEYKRPTFQVEFPKINEKYDNGDTLVVKAKALTYAGVPVQGATVRYTVNRRPALWWQCFMPTGLNVQIGRDETVTGSDGTFVIRVPMVLPEENSSRAMFYNFVVEAQVTDVGGESHSGTVSIPLGNRPTAFSCDLPEKALGDSLRAITFSLRNAAGMEIGADVRFAIDGTEPVQTVHTGQPYALTEKLKSGRHTLFAVCENDTLRQDFVVFSLDDERPCEVTPDWFYVSSETFPADGSSVTMQAGSSDSDVHIVYTIISGDKVLESGAVDKSNALVNRKLTYKEEYGNGLLLNYAWVKNGRCYTHTATIARPLPDRRLSMRWTTFRDRLKPGQSEEWSLSVMMPDGKPADALLMATLYDKSLDQISVHGWHFSPVMFLSQPYTVWHERANMSIGFYGSQQWKTLAFREFAPSRIDRSLFMQSFYALGGTRNVFASAAQSSLKKVHVRGTSQVLEEHAVLSRLEKKDATGDVVAYDTPEETGYANADGDGDNGQDGESVQMRENLNETAFFYPDARTDADGNVTLRFTLPESLTTWRFMGLAHTADMFSGMLDGEAVAKKEIMIQPNVPRFARIGDNVNLSARIFNSGEAEATGWAKMEMVDPETERVVATSSRPFSVKPGETGTVTFNYIPKADNTLLICRITASGKTFSDGEQHYLPILPDRERVTVTVPFTQPEPGTKTIDISKLMPKDAKGGKLTVEYANNPAWMMMQALPSVGMPLNDNAINLAAALYANSLADYIVKQNPKVKTTFEQWKRETGSETSLMSNLEKNMELKDIMLAETPWVADADRESEQKERMADFFDSSALQHRLTATVDKLAALQKTDGSWSWWPGMDGSRYMTVEVASMLVRLNAMTGRQQATEKMLSLAFDFMGKDIVKLVADMKKNEKKGAKLVSPGGTALQFLYLSALDGRKLPADVQSASDYLITLLKKDIKSQTIYDKALTTVILSKHGETARSREYVKSLKEYTVYTDEAGRYYDTRRAAYSWADYRIPTEVAAMEAIAAVTPDDTQTIDEMRRWLLHEKRTQAWDTPINSVNAVYAFLAGNGTALTAQEPAKLAIDGRNIELPKATAGTGYVKTSITSPAGNTFTATKTSTGTSWGALYAQFMQKTSEVEAHGSGISVKREIVNVPGFMCGEALSEGGERGCLTVGSRIIVRITIEARHDLDFVQVADRRAACMEPVTQLSGYRNGAYCSPKDNATYFYFDRLTKGKHVIETEYYIDRAGKYETGTCHVECAYAPEYRATAASQTITVK